MTIESSIVSIQQTRRSLDPLTGAERRATVATIFDAITAFAPVSRAVSQPIYGAERCYAGRQGWHRSDSPHRGFMAFRQDTREDLMRPHSWTGIELWISADGHILEATIAGWCGGLAAAGELVEEETRTFRRVGVREIARRFGLHFVTMFAARLDDAAQQDEAALRKCIAQLAKLQRVREALA